LLVLLLLLQEKTKGNSPDLCSFKLDWHTEWVCSFNSPQVQLFL
jgi:hypothetical protein